MNFNYIIGNPPYQEPKLTKEVTNVDRDTNGGATLFYKILNNLYGRYQNEMIMLTPVKIGTSDILFKNGLQSFEFFKQDKNGHYGEFFEDIGVSIVMWKLKRGYQGMVDVTYSDGSVVKLKSNPIYPKEKMADFTLYTKIKESYSKWDKISSLGPSGKKFMKTKKDSKYKYPVITKMKSKYSDEVRMYSKDDLGNHRRISHPISQKLTPYQVHDSHDNYFCLFHETDVTAYNEDQIQNIKGFLCSEVTQIIAEFIAKKIGSMRYFPVPLDAIAPLTNKEIISLFGLTDEDWEIIVNDEVLLPHVKTARKYLKDQNEKT